MKSYDRLFIGGEWVEPSSSSVFDVFSPTTEELVGRVPRPRTPMSTGRWPPPVRPSTTGRGPGWPPPSAPPC